MLAWCHFEVHFRGISTKWLPAIFRIICVGKRQYHCGEWTSGNSIIPLDSGIFQSLRPSNILLHYFPKILIICLSTKPCFLSSPVSRFARSMFYFAVQVSAHLWAVSDRSWDTSKYLKGLAQKFKFFGRKLMIMCNISVIQQNIVPAFSRHLVAFESIGLFANIVWELSYKIKP